jgi:hypothetical protein
MGRVLFLALVKEQNGALQLLVLDISVNVENYSIHILLLKGNLGLYQNPK